MAKYETHQFYCLNCGRPGIPCQRKVGFQHKPFHRKKLYCIYCKAEVNHIECKTEEQVQKFKINFEKGLYKDEAQESLVVSRNSGLW